VVVVVVVVVEVVVVVWYSTQYILLFLRFTNVFLKINFNPRRCT
jgi:hypothetical protein